MQVTERLEAIAKVCREHYNPFPEPLIKAMCQYLAGQGSLTQIQQEWKAARNITAYYYSNRFIILSDASGEYLDELDLRILDICVAVSLVVQFLQIIAEQGPIEQAYAYLLSQGVDKRRILKELIEAGNYVSNSEQVTALGRYLLLLLPEHSGDILNILAQGPWVHNSLPFIKLLLAAQPNGYLDLAEQVAQAAQLQAITSYLIGDYAALLVRHDYTRFREWARQIAGPASPGGEHARIVALQALLECNSAANIDLAVEAARTPLGTYRWTYAELQRTGLGAAYQLDPVKYLSLVEEAIVAPNAYLGKYAVELLKEAEFEEARPILQHCIASGNTEAALQALDGLLQHDWPERQTYMLSLLPHRSKQIRDALIAWLIKEGESIVEPLAPYLTHSNADARLTAVLALQCVGGEQVRSLFADRLDTEKSLKVKQAMLDVIGVATLAEATTAASTSPVEALTAEAEAALKRVTKPALLWFDAAQYPAPRWKDDEPVPPVVLNYLVYCQSRTKGSALDERVEKALALFDRSGLGDLALAQFNGWIGHGAKSEQAWYLPLVCACADERLIHPLRQHIDGWVKTARGTLAARAVGAMALIEGDLALAEINDLAERVKYSQVKAAAKKALIDAANHRNISLEELSDLIVPALGFDEKGERIFDYGPRQFTVHLRLDQTLQITDNAGKRVTTLPKPGACDDESKAKAALAAWSLLKKQVPQVVKMQTRHLEYALISQRAWKAERWQSLFLKHPVLRSFAITLVWGVIIPGQTEYQALFRPLEDGSLTDTEDNTVTLPAEGTVRMVHPIELDEETCSAWLQHLPDYEITPPFPQLNRPIVRVSPDQCSALWWEKYKGYLMNGGALKGRFMKAGWERGSVQDAGGYYEIWKAFPAAGIQAVLETAGMSVGYEQEFNTAIKRLAFARIDTIKRGSYVYDDLKDQDERIIKLGDVPPIVFSEAAVDMQTFAAVGEYAEDWEKKIW